VLKYHISPSLWGTSGSNIGRIGVIAHETGHYLGLPDLYDTDTDGGGSGIGSYSLMANAWGFDGTQFYPPQMDPWCKMESEWANVVELTSSTTVTIYPSYSTNQYYKIATGYKTNEYLVIEYRTKKGFDLMVPTEGLAIYHIDNLASYNTESYPQSGFDETIHYRVALLQADGNYDLEKGNDRGDGSEVFRSSPGVDSLGPGNGLYVNGGNVFPNTDSYQGSVVKTGYSILNVGSADGGLTMTFDFTTCTAKGATCGNGKLYFNHCFLQPIPSGAICFTHHHPTPMNRIV
jgi:hypothetical protein